MFSAVTKPLPLSEACIQCLCASLNAPVVRLEGLRNGPARAAVVVYAEQYGDLGLAVAVRSLEGGEVVLMRARESLPPETDPRAALELAISFGESLGFVFDVDMLAGGADRAARHAALEHWQRLVSSDEVFAAADVTSPPMPRGAISTPDPARLPQMEDLLSGAMPEGEMLAEIELDELSLGDIGAEDLDTGGGELLLDDIAPLEIGDGEIDGASAAAARAHVVQTETTEPGPRDAARTTRGTTAFAPSSLSKFRRPAESADADEAGEEEAAGGGSALGRIRIVRMKKSMDGRAAARARVLASY